MERFIQLLRAPGARGTITSAAPTQRVKDSPQVTDDTATGYTPPSKSGQLDRWLDTAVRLSGSEVMFLAIMAGLLTWAFLGISFRASTDWQVVISDVQAIMTYIFDSLLMRQQLNSYGSVLEVTAVLRSRDGSHKRMLRILDFPNAEREKGKPAETNLEVKQDDFALGLPEENWLGKISTQAAWFVGHIVTVACFWVAIFVWVGFGHSTGWSAEWELDINSATSALMVFIFAFLANIRERHAQYTARCLDCIYKADSALEAHLRLASGDAISNTQVTIEASKVSRIQRAIDYYADVVGTLVGIVLLVLVMTVWIAIGPALQFSPSWWLFIGTYAGLVGMNDGFVLRNIDYTLRRYEDEQLELVRLDDLELFAYTTCSPPVEADPIDRSLTGRLSSSVGKICSHEVTVVVGTATVIGLVIGSSAMHWSLQGQLLSNIPPSIIESFFMMILITGHNGVDARRRIVLRGVYERRLKLLAYVKQRGKFAESDNGGGKDGEREVAIEE